MDIEALGEDGLVHGNEAGRKGTAAGTIGWICLSRRKGVVKRPVSRAVLRRGWGIVGDAHAGRWHRQISILACESIERVKVKIPDLEPGAFAENLVTRGIDIGSLRPGDRLRIGARVLLRVTQIGKECHTGCRIKASTGECIMPREGVFAVVVEGGSIDVGDPVQIERAVDAGTEAAERGPGTGEIG